MWNTDHNCWKPQFYRCSLTLLFSFVLVDVMIYYSLLKVFETSVPARDVFMTPLSVRNVFSCDNCFPWSYNLVINQPDLCQTSCNAPIDIVFVIPTTDNNRKQRTAIRHTWTSITRNNTSNFRHVFILGVPNQESQTRMRKLAEESRHFRDIVMFKFVDTYRNLTMKTLMMFKWVTEHCANVRFVVKADDDMWINTQALLLQLTASEHHLKKSIGGYCNMTSSVMRKPITHKWHVTYLEYPVDHYPRFCSGTTYATTLSVLRAVLNVSHHVPFFHLEDVFIGLCLKKLGYSVKTLWGFHIDFCKYLEKNPCVAWAPKAVTFHQTSAELLYYIWNASCGEKSRLLPPIVQNAPHPPKAPILSKPDEP